MKRNCLLSLCWLMSFSALVAQNNIATLSLGHIEETHMQQSTVINQDTVLTLNYPEAITGLSISGTATFNHASNSLVRITLQDDYNTEWLVYELFPLLADSNTVSFSNVAFETSVLDNVTAQQLNIKIINASLQLDEINTTNQAVASYSMQQSRAMQAQSSYIIDRLNENLEKRNIPWRAGETSISQMTYEEKKAMFGGEVPNLGGFEYYKGGIFVIPDYEPATNDGIATAATTEEEEDPYVKEWDWRNRHGKNWMTPVKDQGGCGSCWAFATLGTLEAYINLYYNRLLNLDLSEQELVSCATTFDESSNRYVIGKGCSGGTFLDAVEYIENNGIMDEASFPYTEQNGNCNEKPAASIERIFTTGSQNYSRTFKETKPLLFKSPLCISLPGWNHAAVLVGYKTLQCGDIVDTLHYKRDTISANSPFIGKTAYIIKNSVGEWWGENGYGYVVFDDNSIVDTYSFENSFIQSLNLTNDSILNKDEDEDGYYFHGISPVSFSLPRWRNEVDWDDNNDNYARIDSYGHLVEITTSTTFVDIPTPTSSYLFPNEEYWGFIPNHIVIRNGGTLTMDEDYLMYKDATITVQNGGNLTISGCTIRKANITLESGATMNLTNNGHITLDSEDNFCAKQGSIVNIGNNCSIGIK